MLHSKLAPSSAARRVACSGSRALEEHFPQLSDTPASREGATAHWVAAETLAGRAVTDETITDEMRDGARLYVDTITAVCEDVSALHIEERVDISSVHPDCFGTPDAWFIDGSHLHIFDYKYGHGYVDAFENWQLISYSSGILQTVNATQITLWVVQPRNYHAQGPVRSWTVGIALLQHYIDRLRTAEHLAMTDDARRTPGSGCTYCSGRHACDALQTVAAAAADLSATSTPQQMTPTQTGRELTYLKEAAKLIDARITGLEAEAVCMITQGERVVGFKLEPGRSSERWSCSPHEAIELGEMLGVSLSKPAEAITPVQARKLGVDDAVLQAYTQRVTGALKLTVDDQARRIFG